jgi:hypothetical protein
MPNEAVEFQFRLKLPFFDLLYSSVKDELDSGNAILNSEFDQKFEKMNNSTASTPH